MIVEIAHPNNLDSWTQVDEVTSLIDLKDALSAPSFEWFHGLCVRASTENSTYYTGIFNATECVDVGPHSLLMENYYKPYYSSFKFMREFSLFDTWKNCPRPSWLVQMFGALMTREQFIRACYRIAREMKRYFINDVFMMLSLQCAMEYLEGHRTKEQVHVIRDRVMDVANSAAGWAVAHALGVVISDEDGLISYADECISAAERACDAHGASFRRLREILHEEVPFYDIATKITQ